MVVQHNLRAMNSNRMLGITSGILSKSAEKLSSGYKVNRAADDAAGLSISEKMRKQIRGLTQATANAEDGISSVQTAEGALTEVHDMLQRMNELANKASNGTNSVSDRQTIQDEVDQLLTEIDRVSETTKFNEIYLLKGSAQGTESSQYVNAHDAGIKGTLVDNGGATAKFSLKKALAAGDKINIAGQEYEIGDKVVTDPTKGLAKYAATAPTDVGKTKLTYGDTITYDVSEDNDGSEFRTVVMSDEVKSTSAKVTTAFETKGTFFSIEGDTREVYAITTSTVTAQNFQMGSDAYLKDTYVHAITSDDAKKYLDEALKAGKKVTLLATAAAGAAADAFNDTTKLGAATLATDKLVEKNWTIVKELGKDANGADKIGKDVWTDTTSDEVDELFTTNVLKTKPLNATTGALDTNIADTDVADRISSVTLADKTTTFTTEKPIGVDAIANAVKNLQVGDQMWVKDGDASVTDGLLIEIADATDATKFKYTTEDALKLINDRSEVAFASSNAALINGLGLKNGIRNTTSTELGAMSKADLVKKTGVGLGGKDTTTADVEIGSVIGQPAAPGVPSAAKKTISVDEAYTKIADALTQASSIGTDANKGASVVNDGDGSFTIKKGTATVTDALAFNLHVGADADMTNKISVKIDTMDTKGLGIQGLDIIGRNAAGDKVDDGGMAATYAIDSISDAIAKVSAQRSLLGAVQNRLDHTINNLGNVVENTTAAESQIRDTDMATEMVKFSNSNILAQAGQSMLAQANQANQGVLSLLG